jgi:predicted RNA-binding protein
MRKLVNGEIIVTNTIVEKNEDRVRMRGVSGDTQEQIEMAEMIAMERFES